MIPGWLRLALHDFWSGEAKGVAGRATTMLLAPAELPFRIAVSARNAWYSRGAAGPTSVPVVSVGNLTVGGTGKTPVVRWLAEWFRARGLRPAIVMRGYGADEVALYRRWFDRGAVFVGPDRVSLVAEAGQRGHRVALVDDGYQHRRLHRDVDVLLVAAEDPWPVRMLPRGPYREPLAAAGRATHLLVTRRSPCRKRSRAWGQRLGLAAPAVPLQEVELCMTGWSDLSGARRQAPDGDVLAVCSIARPEAFVAGINRLLPGARVEPVAFADHHEFSPRDVSGLLGRLAARTLVCTEKDAVKLEPYEEMMPHCAVVGFGVAGEPAGALGNALATVGESVRGAELREANG